MYEVARAVVHECEVLYFATGDARHLRSALSQCTFAGLPVPAWLRDGLDKLITDCGVDKALRIDTKKHRRSNFRRTVIWCLVEELRAEKKTRQRGDTDIVALFACAAGEWNINHALRDANGRFDENDQIGGETAKKDYYAKKEERQPLIKL